jgi:hypothetical protein
MHGPPRKVSHRDCHARAIPAAALLCGVVLLSGCSLLLSLERLPASPDAGVEPVGGEAPDGAGPTADADQPAGPAQIPVLWEHAVGVNAGPGALGKTAAAGWGNAGASSVQRLVGDGSLATTVAETNSQRIFGLSYGDRDAGPESIGWAFFLASDGTLAVRESGAVKAALGSYQTGDVLVIQRVGAMISYSQNGEVRHRSTVAAPGSELMVDAALDSAGATLAQVLLAGEVRTVDAAPVSWNSAAGVVVHGGSLVKSASTAWGNAGASSTQGIARDGGVRVAVGETSSNRMIGLSLADADLSYSSIGWALYLTASGALHVYEAGVSRGVIGIYDQGDVLSVQRTGTTVRYLRNGIPLYRSSVAAEGTLLVDSALYTVSASLLDARLLGP